MTSHRVSLLAFELHCVIVVPEKEVVLSIDDFVRTVTLILQEFLDFLLCLAFSVGYSGEQININS
jgi:hypothetical protein